MEVGLSLETSTVSLKQYTKFGLSPVMNRRFNDAASSLCCAEEYKIIPTYTSNYNSNSLQADLDMQLSAKCETSTRVREL